MWYYFITPFLSLIGLLTNFEYIIFFSCPTERNIFYKRFISIKPLWLEIIEKKGCTKSLRASTIIYIIYITRTDLITSSQSCSIDMDLLQKMFFVLLRHEKLVNNPYEFVWSIFHPRCCYKMNFDNKMLAK